MLRILFRNRSVSIEMLDPVKYSIEMLDRNPQKNVVDQQPCRKIWVSGGVIQIFVTEQYRILQVFVYKSIGSEL